MDREKSGFEPVTFWIAMADTVQSLTPSGLEIAQCRLQSQFVVENCRARTECRTDVSTCIRAILGPYTGRFFQEKPLFQEKTTSKSFITRGRCNLHPPPVMFKQVIFSRKNDLFHFFGNQSQISGGKPISQDRETRRSQKKMTPIKKWTEKSLDSNLWPFEFLWQIQSRAWLHQV